METKTNYPDEIVSAGQLLRMLDSDAKEISTLCQRACLKPKKDGFGNIYFSKSDVDVLRKVKELYEHTKQIREERIEQQEQAANVKENKLKRLREEKKETREAVSIIEETPVNVEKTLPAKFESKIDSYSSSAFLRKMDSVENNVITKITDVLSEKLDGLDEVIVELIKAKSENESLRQKVNELNKENFALKSENSSYKPVALGFYVKKAPDEFTF